MIDTYPQKWRPTLATIIAGIVVFVLSLPLAGLMIFRFYDGQLVRETETELIAQGAVLSALIANEIAEEGFPADTLGAPLPEDLRPGPEEVFQPIETRIDLFTAEVFPLRPEAEETERLVSENFRKLGEKLQTIVVDTQRRTLAGFRILDPTGLVITGRNEVGQSLAHIYEVRGALQGRYRSVVRRRFTENPAPALSSISRSARIRVYVAMPVIVGNHVAGVVYLSRTPNNVARVLYQRRGIVALTGLFILSVSLAIAIVFLRTVKRPIDELNRRTNAISAGDRSAIKPLSRHGSKEFANLAKNVFNMSSKLFERADYIKTFAAHVTHELKSPLTSIHGAAELMRDGHADMSEEERRKFLDNILADTTRLSVLLERLRDYAVAENPQLGGTCDLAEIAAQLRGKFPDLAIETRAPNDLVLPMLDENALIVFSNLAENAAHHGAKKIAFETKVQGKDLIISVTDDGTGISEHNREKIFELFFTTRRGEGGTGMGLQIVRAILQAHRGDIAFHPTEVGTRFDVTLPKA
ncbi:MAG: ATP-binding protein [Pseudomonadota bacterium]